MDGGCRKAVALLKELQRALLVHQRLQVTVWDPEDSEFEYTFDSVVLDVEGLTFKIAPPSGAIERVHSLLSSGVIVGMLMDAYPNPFIFYPVVHLYQPRPIPGYWLKIPEDCSIEVVQRRKHVRIPMTVPLVVEFQGLIDDEMQWCRVNATTEDVSGGGMRITSPRKFVPNEEIRIRVKFNRDLPELNLEARVVFSVENRVRVKDDDFFATACQFINLDKHTETIIVRECFRRELDLRR